MAAAFSDPADEAHARPFISRDRGLAPALIDGRADLRSMLGTILYALPLALVFENLECS